MLKIRLIVLCAAVLLLGAQMSVAQDNMSLRELADRNHLYIGAATWASYLDNAPQAETMRREFNMLVPEHEAKFCMVEQQEGVVDFRAVDKLVAFAEANDMTVRGHTLLWHQCEPSWLEDLDLTRDEAIAIMRTHIYTEVGRYRGRIAMWDVVNEAIDGGRHRNTIWQQWIGDDWIDLAFQFAHEADPEALLFYNDYGAEGKNLKSNTIYDMVSSMVERGVPINGVGLQMHLNVGATAPGGSLQPVDLAANIQRLGELGLEVHITEMDVGYQGETTDAILQQQAADYRRVMSVCLEEEACKAFVVWGVSGRYSWKRNDNTPNVEPLLFNQDFEPQPAYDALRDLLARQAGLAPILSDAQVQAMMGGPQTETHAVDIPAPVKSDPNQLAPDPVPGLIYYAPFNVSITLDGETDDWANVPRVTVDQALYAPDGDTTAYEFAAAADERNLYFLAVVHDAHIVQGLHPTSDWWQEDGVEFYLNTTGDLKATAYAPGIVQIGIMAANITGPDEPIIGGSSSADAHAQVVAQETDDGYLIEASVPLDNGAIWQIVPEQGGVLGFQSHLNGASVQDRDTKLIWSAADTQDQSYSNPSLFGQLIFWDATQ